MDYYFENTLPYTKITDHFVNEKYTTTMFIYSECTEDLLNQGYYKIDSTELYKTMKRESHIKDNIYLFSLFISYNYHNYYRFQNLYGLFMDPEEVCPSCLDMTYEITNNYIRNIKDLLGPSTGSLVESEHINIFSEESTIFNDVCNNLTLERIDVPLTERLKFFYLYNYSTPIACSGINCKIKEINVEESTSVCICDYGIKFEDIFKPLPEFKNYDDNNQNNKKISVGAFDTFGTVKCLKSGFNKKNILANGGFIIALIAMVLSFVLYLSYCICSKVINLEKGSNPPSKIKNRILIFNDWLNPENRQPVSASDNSNNLIQSRDEDDCDLFEEDLTFSNKFDSSSYSIDVNYKTSNSKTNKQLSEKAGRRILVLIPNVKRRNRNDERRSGTFSDTEFILTDKSKKKKQKSFCQIYWYIVSIKQHIINFFSSIKCCKITESFVPIPIRLMRSILIIVLALFINIFFLNQNYYSQKFSYFNENYKILSVNTVENIIKVENRDENKIPLGKTISYALSHVFVNAIIAFAILLVLQFIICYLFFSLRKKVLEVIKKNDLDGIQDLVLKTRLKYILFFIITMVLLFVFLLFFVGFGAAYGGGFVDYFVAGIISLIFLELFPFLWSLILALFLFIGIRKGNKCCYEFSQFFIF
jgi:hypothetical protein